MHVEIWKTTKKLRPWEWYIQNIPPDVHDRRVQENICNVGFARTEDRAKAKGCKVLMKFRKIQVELEREYNLERDTKKKVECE